MKIETEHPFLNYDCYLNFNVGLGRNQVCLKDRQTKQQRTLLYSKYLMSIKLGRILEAEEEVDHIDNNKLNDNIDNLQILTGTQNRKKNSTGRTMVDLKCDNCNKEFSREKRLFAYRKKTHRVYCSKSCQHGPN